MSRAWSLGWMGIGLVLGLSMNGMLACVDKANVKVQSMPFAVDSLGRETDLHNGR